MEKVSVGRIVHYVLGDGPHAGCHRPAIVTEVTGFDTVSLVVFKGRRDDHTRTVRTHSDYAAETTTADPSFLADDVLHDEGASVYGTWHWPERS